MSVLNNMNSTNKSNSSLSSFGSGNLHGYASNQSTNTFRVNPTMFSSLKNLDVEKLEEDLAKEIQRKKVNEERERRTIQKIFEDSDEIKEIKNRIKLASLNKERTKQIFEKQTRRLQDITKDAEVDEKLLLELEEEQRRQREIENSKKGERIQSKFVLQQQMKEKEKLREESRKEYLRDKQLVDDIVTKIIKEDLDTINENKKKKEMTRTHMLEAYAEKEMMKAQQKEEERIQKEKERQYLEEVVRRDREQKEKKAMVQFEKDKIFERLSLEAAKTQAEKEYWENVRNELYWEETAKREKIKELQEKEKKQRYYYIKNPINLFISKTKRRYVTSCY
jgi:hypothetical protein